MKPKINLTKSLYEQTIKLAINRLKNKISNAKTKKEMNKLLIAKELFFAKLKKYPDSYEKFRLIEYELTEKLIFEISGIMINFDSFK